MAILTDSTVCSNLGTTDQIDGPCGTRRHEHALIDVCPVDCDGDVNGDGQVNVTDLLAVIAGWGNPYDVSDLLAVIAGWGSCP